VGCGSGVSRGHECLHAPRGWVEIYDEAPVKKMLDCADVSWCGLAIQEPSGQTVLKHDDFILFSDVVLQLASSGGWWFGDGLEFHATSSDDEVCATYTKSIEISKNSPKIHATSSDDEVCATYTKSIEISKNSPKIHPR
jgi:hypothetical protein